CSKSPLITRTCWAKQGIATAREVTIKAARNIRKTPSAPNRSINKIGLGWFQFKCGRPHQRRPLQALGGGEEPGGDGPSDSDEGYPEKVSKKRGAGGIFSIE